MCLFASTSSVSKAMVKQVGEPNAVKQRACRVIKVGSDFSGINATGVSIGRLLPSTKFRIMFGSEILPACLKVLREMKNKAEVMHGDVQERNLDDVPYVDCYIWTPPCQSFSMMGKQKGCADARGQLIAEGVRYIVKKMPRIAILENVPGLMNKKNRPVVKGIHKALQKAGYVPSWKILNAKDFGVPQCRRRVFMVALLKEKGRFKWPRPSKTAVLLGDILDPVGPNDKPGRMPRGKTGRRNMKTGCRKAWELMVDPLKVPVAIDVDASPKFFTMGIDEAKTLTRSRGMSGGPWISSRGRRCSVNELLKLQGFKASDVPWQAAGVTEAQIGGMIGNSVAVPVLEAILSAAFRQGGILAE